MTLGKMLHILQENNVPKSARLMSNSGWECCATDMDGIYYSKKLNIVIFTQGTEFESNCGYEASDGYKLLYKCADT